MKRYVKKFNELSNDELFEIFKLRISVFVVEQNCAYQDIDDYDKKALHLFFKEEDKIIAYLRILPENTVFNEVSIGRVISVKRRQGIASELLDYAVKTAFEYYKTDIIMVEAQVYAKKLYENRGFKQISEEFLEDDIPHINMVLSNKK